MSRYDRYDTEALDVLRQAQEFARRKNENQCDSQDFLTGLILTNTSVFNELLNINRFTLLPRRVDTLKEALLQRPQDSNTPRQTESKKLGLSNELRTILDTAEALAGDTDRVKVEHLLHAAWPIIGAKLLSCVKKEGGLPDPDKVILPPLPKHGPSTTETNDQGDKKPLKVIPEIARDLTAEAPPFPIIGREEEIGDLISILLKCFKPNPLLLGEPGVGKTALVEGLANRIRSGLVPEQLKGCRVFELRISDLFAGTSKYGSFEKRMQDLVEELESNPDIILFLDEIHQLVKTGRTDNPADILKPAFSRGHFRCIGATTPSEYHRFMRQDSALVRRFHSLQVEEPDDGETRQILEGLKPTLEDHFRIQIPADIIELSIRLGKEYLVNRRFPDKALDILDRACTAAVAAARSEVSAEELRMTVARLTGIAFVEDSERLSDRLKRLEQTLAKEILGQDEAIHALSNTVRVCKRRMDLRPERPDGVFLFMGPTGVGKTALAEALARALTGSDEQLIRIDMSELSENHSIARLIGAPPGYVGYEEQSQFQRDLQKKPNAVLLLDEFEKAHAQVHQVFLQVFDSGRLTTGQGETIYLSNITIIATANIMVTSGNRLGFAAKTEAHGEKDLLDTLKAHFPTELINRFDEIASFRPLEEDTAREILKKRILILANENLRERHGIQLVLDRAIQDLILQEGYSKALGARNLQRAFEELILRPLAQQQGQDCSLGLTSGSPQRIRVTQGEGKKICFMEADAP